jgi:hypothetical protein
MTFRKAAFGHPGAASSALAITHPVAPRADFQHKEIAMAFAIPASFAHPEISLERL